MKAIGEKILKKLPPKFRDNAMIFFFGLLKVPLIGYVRPKVITLNTEKTVIKIPLNWRTKNHLGSMYFGAMATAADICSGLAAMKQIVLSGKNIHLSFKDFQGEFHKRAEGATYFTCNQGREIQKFVDEVIKSKERMNMPIKVVATVPEHFGDVPVATFTLTLSLKHKD
ncbi:MAG: DUF4442 domain-containing protein [Deltaproteobacteria bacterium]|nr:MAG: DUF4442 domain-containing protein [Deltaproteobacteria bacterium]